MTHFTGINNIKLEISKHLQRSSATNCTDDSFEDVDFYI